MSTLMTAMLSTFFQKSRQSIDQDDTCSLTKIDKASARPNVHGQASGTELALPRPTHRMAGGSA